MRAAVLVVVLLIPAAAARADLCRITPGLGVLDLSGTAPGGTVPLAHAADRVVVDRERQLVYAAAGAGRDPLALSILALPSFDLLAEVALPIGVEDMVLTPDGATLFAFGPLDDEHGDLLAFDTATHALRRTTLDGYHTYQLALGNFGRFLYASRVVHDDRTYAAFAVDVIDTTDGHVVARYRLADSSAPIDVVSLVANPTADVAYLLRYTHRYFYDRKRVWRLRPGHGLKALSAGGRFDHLAVSPDGRRIFARRDDYPFPPNDEPGPPTTVIDSARGVVIGSLPSDVEAVAPDGCIYAQSARALTRACLDDEGSTTVTTAEQTPATLEPLMRSSRDGALVWVDGRCEGSRSECDSDGVCVRLGDATGAPGDTVQLMVSLDADGWQFTELEAQVETDLTLPVDATRTPQRLVPACTALPDRSKFAALFQCLAGSPTVLCAGINSLLFTPPGRDPFPDRGPVYSCAVSIPPGSQAGRYRVACAYAQATDDGGNYFPTSCADGSITVTGGGAPGPTPTATVPAIATIVPTRGATDGDACAISGTSSPSAWPALLPLLLALARRRSAGPRPTTSQSRLHLEQPTELLETPVLVAQAR